MSTLPPAPRLRPVLASAAAWLAALLLVSATGASAQSGGAAPRIVGQSAIVVDADTGRVLYEKNADSRRPVASTQKLLTTLIIAEDERLDEEIVVQKGDSDVSPTKLYLKEGEKFTRRQLIQALLLKSYNDVARCLARDYAGSEENFARVMTARARLLGMRDSQFQNASGLPAEEQFSTARDMALLARAAHSNPTVREIIGTEQLEFRRPGHKVAMLSNSNRLLRSFEWCDGMKTGYTNAAGRCLVSSATKNGRTIVSVVLGSTPRDIWNDSERLLEYGLAEVAPNVRPDHAIHTASTAGH